MDPVDCGMGPEGAPGPEEPCGLAGATPVDPGAAGAAGMVVRVGEAWFDLGDPGDPGASVTLADDRGLSIYADRDGDGAVDHVTTVLFDGTWRTWSDPAADGGEGAAADHGAWDAGDWGRLDPHGRG